MRKRATFTPNGVVLSFPVAESSLVEALFIALSDEQKFILKGLDGFSLVRLNYSPWSIVLGNQAVNVEVSAFTSHLRSELTTAEELFAEYGEWHFGEEQYRFLD